jgi:proteasome lid subunit RPN8/RPN11
MTVHRTRPLPTGPARGRLVITADVRDRTRQLLAQAGATTPPHEGLVWWLGRKVGTDTYVMSTISPAVDSGPQHVIANESSVGAAATAARALRLGIVAQTHSHPGVDTRHSDGDDDLVLMPFEGMYSIVTARYGHGDVLPAGGAGVHQFQDGRWVLVTGEDTLIVVPDEVHA